MSSRVIRPGDRKADHASVWRPSESGGTVRYRSGGPHSDLKREFEMRAQAAYQQGLAAGIQQASARIEPAAAALNRIVGELAGLRKQFRAEVEQDTVKLAVAIARRVIHRELATDPEAILGLVIAALQKLNARETQRLRLSPADAAIVQEQRARFEFPAALEIAADASLPAGSAIFETSRGELDASVGTQLAEIERGFADLVKGRCR